MRFARFNLARWVRHHTSDCTPAALPARPGGSPLTRYAVSIMSVLLATGIRLALTPLLKEHHAYTLFFAAIAVTAWFAGFWPSIVAAVLAYILADWIIITPRFELD